jgi:hypothetical protein
LGRRLPRYLDETFGMRELPETAWRAWRRPCPIR